VSPEIVARVDAWLAAQPDKNPWLAHDWRSASTLWRYRRAKDPEDASGTVASAAASMRGILLALVRDAWGDSRASATPERGRPGEEWACCVLPPASKVGRMFVAGSEDDAIVAALEAAPRREVADG
jgi:hypothetical protein